MSVNCGAVMFIPKADAAIAALNEAIELALGEVDASARFRKLLDSGLPLFRVEIEGGPAAGALNGVVTYKPSDALAEYLSAGL